MTRKRNYTPSLEEALLRKSIESSPMGKAQGMTSVEVPVVKAPRIDDLRIQVVEPSPPSQEDLLNRLGALCLDEAKRIPISSGNAVDWGDEILMDAVTYCRGKIVPFLARGDFRTILGSQELLPGLDEKLVGLKVGQTHNLQVVLPEDFPFEKLRNQPAVMAVHLQQAHRLELEDPESPAFLQRTNDGQDFETLLQRLYEELVIDAREAGELEAIQEVLSEIGRRVQESISNDLIDEEVSRQWKENEGKVLFEKNVAPEDREDSLKQWLEFEPLREIARLKLAISSAVIALAARDKIQMEKEDLEAMLREMDDTAQADDILKAVNKGDTSAQEGLFYLAYLHAVDKIISRIQRNEGPPARNG